jgi:uncharacterized metal-binding protein
VGELSDRIARTLSKDGKGKLFCLAVVGARVGDKMESLVGKETVAIDGCSVMCAKKVLEAAGFAPKSFNLADLGYQKGKVVVDAALISEAAARITI